MAKSEFSKLQEVRFRSLPGREAMWETVRKAVFDFTCNVDPGLEATTEATRRTYAVLLVSAPLVRKLRRSDGSLRAAGIFTAGMGPKTKTWGPVPMLCLLDTTAKALRWKAMFDIRPDFPQSDPDWEIDRSAGLLTKPQKLADKRVVDAVVDVADEAELLIFSEDRIELVDRFVEAMERNMERRALVTLSLTE